MSAARSLGDDPALALHDFAAPIDASDEDIAQEAI